MIKSTLKSIPKWRHVAVTVLFITLLLVLPNLSRLVG